MTKLSKNRHSKNECLKQDNSERKSPEQNGQRESKPFYRTIRSFVKREGKITSGQQAAIDELWATHGVDTVDKIAQSDAQFNWQKLFGNDNSIVMEIGFGNGLSLADMAETDAESNFFGIEVHRPGLGSLLVQVKQRELNNVRVSGDDAVEVLKRVPDRSLDRLQIFFPDPWHKKRHHKRRLIQKNFAEEAAKKLKQGGVFHVATDWENYAEQVLEVLSDVDSLRNRYEGFGIKPDYRPETKYERRGLKLGHGVWDILFEKHE